MDSRLLLENWTLQQLIEKAQGNQRDNRRQLWGQFQGFIAGGKAGNEPQTKICVSLKFSEPQVITVFIICTTRAVPPTGQYFEATFGSGNAKHTCKLSPGLAGIGELHTIFGEEIIIKCVNESTSNWTKAGAFATVSPGAPIGWTEE